jgi:Rrf2 family protein
MRFTKTAEYAIRILLFLSAEAKQYSAREIHERLKIPYKYLTRVMQQLEKAGFLEVRQGKTGGYRCSGSSDQVTLSRIIDAVEGLEDYSRCVLGFESCSDETPCALHKRWAPHRAAIYAMLNETTLKELNSDLENEK